MIYSPRHYKRAAEMVVSLVSEGYKIQAHSDACGLYFLRHSTNHNVMRVEVGSLGVYIYKNNRLLKIDLVR